MLAALAAPALHAFGPSLAGGLAEGLVRPAALFRLTWASAGAVAALGIAVSLGAGVVPAVRAALIRPIEVLK